MWTLQFQYWIALQLHTRPLEAARITCHICDHYSSNCWIAFQLNKETMRGSPQIWNLNAKVWTLMDEKLYFLWINVMGTSPPPPNWMDFLCSSTKLDWGLLWKPNGMAHVWMNIVETEKRWYLGGYILWAMEWVETWLDESDPSGWCSNWVVENSPLKSYLVETTSIHWTLYIHVMGCTFIHWTLFDLYNLIHPLWVLKFLNLILKGYLENEPYLRNK